MDWTGPLSSLLLAGGLLAASVSSLLVVYAGIRWWIGGSVVTKESSLALRLCAGLISRFETKKKNWAGIKGRVQLPNLGIVVLCVCVMLGASVYGPLANRIGSKVTEMHNVYVDEPIGDFSYWLVDEGGKRFFATFCDTIGYPPPFDHGQTIDTLKFKNIGTCWDMRDMHPKYVMRRNPQGDLLLKEN